MVILSTTSARYGTWIIPSSEKFCEIILNKCHIRQLDLLIRILTKSCALSAFIKTKQKLERNYSYLLQISNLQETSEGEGNYGELGSNSISITVL